MRPNDQQSPFSVAIVGGGIVGFILAAGLHKRNIKVHVYEQSGGPREIGAGVAFTGAGQRCMRMIDPAVLKALYSSGSVPLSDCGGHDFLRWVDGYEQPKPDDPYYETPLCVLDAGPRGFEGVRRDVLLESLVKLLPPDVVSWRKRLVNIEEPGPETKLVLKFTDGEEAYADAVVGCDGIKSRVRELILGEGNPASYPHFAHKVAYRCLLPYEACHKVLGDWKGRNFHMHIGPKAHILHYPIANKTQMNFVAFLSDDSEWSDWQHMVSTGSRKDVEKALDGWNQTVQDLVALLPDDMMKWALFDSWDYPAPYYNKGRIVLAGDAAHASTPHHGTGASCGIEDALCLSTLLEQVVKTVNSNGASTKHKALETAFKVFDEKRRTRTQWLVNSSRRVVDLFHQEDWAIPEKRVKAETCFEEVKDRSHKLWHFDPEDMVKTSIKDYNKNMNANE
ncbi:salicylate 1-monooxygenase sala [Colletotrichum navitas]|uniref:Salicylate 1-monooxygenase sala n=1 Tax=Colletotrichum navitas TaxID=681940 RepID=A0AAD8PY58_9PEZI|nr:salicylate 1-monooxygenase sala [Colletotrichum navitas]KAK1585903.1 salicylate 1-monooxygenase sala [Colletotrichum navitas]